LPLSCLKRQIFVRSHYNENMPYVYATEDQDFSDYASGRVIYSQPGVPAFPVRLASEIFQRAAQHLPGQGPLTVYDPTCGGAYHLTALGLLHGNRIARILASDIDPRVVELARRNLALLTPAGLLQRERELRRMLAEYGKESHADALTSLERLKARAAARPGGKPLETRVFDANALDPAALGAALQGENIHIVLCDIPYGQLSSWQIPDSSRQLAGPAWTFLEALQAVLPPLAVVAIAADKAQKLAHPAYRRLERFQVGKRQVSLLTL
jgi:23S rRNA (guanine2535-N1)-methyltransferase